MSCRISDNKSGLVASLYSAGLSARAAAEKVGISTRAASRIVQNFGLPIHAAHNRMPDTQRQDAVRLYVKEEKTMPEVAASLGVGISSVARWIGDAGVSRGYSAAFAMAFEKGRKRRLGTSKTYAWQSSKNGRWNFGDSKWEVVRMSQLDADLTVQTWTRQVERVPYRFDGKSRFYMPDFLITGTDEKQWVEEIKPKSQTSWPINQAKAAAGSDHFNAKGVGYRVMTEIEIGVEAIKSFNFAGLAAPNLDEMRRIKRARNARYGRDQRRPAVEKNRKMYAAKVTLAMDACISGQSCSQAASMSGLSDVTVRKYAKQRHIFQRGGVCE